MAIKILLADDSPHAQRDGARILSELGYQVIAVSNGSAAIKKLEEELPDLMIADTTMPGLSGLEICHRIKANAQWSSIPVLLALAAFELYDAEQGRRAGADGVIQKPFIPSSLEQAVRELLEKYGKAPPPEPLAEEVAAPPAVPPMAPTATPVESEPAVEAEAAPPPTPPEPPPAPEPPRPRWQVAEESWAAPAASPVADFEPPEWARSSAVAASAATSAPMPMAASEVGPIAEAAAAPGPPPESPMDKPAEPRASFAPAAAEMAESPEDDLLLGALREAVAETDARIDLEGALKAIEEVLVQYLSPMIADEVRDQIARRLRLLS